MRNHNSYWPESHSSNSKKKHKRKIVKNIRAMNDNIRLDPLWKGRFVIKCDAIYYGSYEDGCGNYTRAFCTIYDTKKGFYSNSSFNYIDFTLGNGYRFWIWVNEFVNNCTIGED